MIRTRIITTIILVLIPSFLVVNHFQPESLVRFVSVGPFPSDIILAFIWIISIATVGGAMAITNKRHAMLLVATVLIFDAAAIVLVILSAISITTTTTTTATTGVTTTTAHEVVNPELNLKYEVPPHYVRVDKKISWSPLQPGEGYIFARYQSVAHQPVENIPPEAYIEGCSISLGVEANFDELLLSKWFELRPFRPPGTVDESITVAGLPAVQRRGIGEVFGYPFSITYVAHGTVVYVVLAGAYGDDALVEECERDLAMILGSIRVVDHE